MIKPDVYLFHVDEHDRVSSDIEQEIFIASTMNTMKLTVRIMGHAESSFVAIHGVADFFDVKVEWEYEWAFAENEFIQPKVLIAVIN
jgi:hypothetical protein